MTRTALPTTGDPSTAPPARPRRIGRDSALLMAGNVGGAALSFALSALLGRALGASGLGVYAAALAWTFPLALLVDFGVSSLMTRDLAATRAQVRTALALALVQRTALGLLVCAALLLAAPLLADAGPERADLIAGIQLSAPMVLLLPAFNAFSAAFKALGRFAPIPLLTIGMLVAQLALTALVFAAGGGVRAALAVNVLTSAGQIAAAWLVWRALRSSAPPDPHTGPVLPHMRTLLRQAAPFAVAAVLAALQARLALVLLERLATAEQAGWYAAATRFTEAARLLPNGYFAALFPAFAALAAQPPVLRATFRRAALLLSGYGIACALVLMLAGPWLLALVYTAEFAPAAPALIVSGWGLAGSFVRGLLTIQAFAYGREIAVNAANLAALLALCVLCMACIPALGASGAAWAVLGSEVVGLLAVWRIARPAAGAARA
jgi:O-antigen/teichoic acid export membrane protein